MTCCKEILTTAVAVTGGNLILTLPASTFTNGCQYVIRIAQDIPATATNLMPVVFQIGTATTQYPFVKKCGHNVYANQVRTRRRYTILTAADTARFVLCEGQLCGHNCGAVTQLPVPVAVAAAETEEA